MARTDLDLDLDLDDRPVDEVMRRDGLGPRKDAVSLALRPHQEG